MDFRTRIFSLMLAAAVFSPLSLSPEEKTHTVQKGETIFSIARSFGVDRNELMRVNGITDPSKLQAGQRLRIPGDGESPGASGNREEVLHRAVRGDTFYGIARKYGITVNELQAANDLSAGYTLKEGDVLTIPGKRAVVAVAPPVPSAPDRADSRSTQTKALDASIRWPVAARELSYMTGSAGGVIITGERAESVKSLSNGTVISTGPYRGYGRIAIVQAAGGYIYVYGGCEILTVKEGDKVGPGMEMGKLGIDAVTEKPQLFFRVYLNNAPVDPAKAPRA